MAVSEKKPYVTITVTASHQDPIEARRMAFHALGLSPATKELIEEYNKIMRK